LALDLGASCQQEESVAVDVGNGAAGDLSQTKAELAR